MLPQAGLCCAALALEDLYLIKPNTSYLLANDCLNLGFKFCCHSWNCQVRIYEGGIPVTQVVIRLLKSDPHMKWIC